MCAAPTDAAYLGKRASGKWEGLEKYSAGQACCLLLKKINQDLSFAASIFLLRFFDHPLRIEARALFVSLQRLPTNLRQGCLFRYGAALFQIVFVAANHQRNVVAHDAPQLFHPFLHFLKRLHVREVVDQHRAVCAAENNCIKGNLMF